MAALMELLIAWVKAGSAMVLWCREIRAEEACEFQQGSAEHSAEMSYGGDNTNAAVQSVNIVS
jgi:hypothetical protein